jgi:hypothetical protein
MEAISTEAGGSGREYLLAPVFEVLGLDFWQFWSPKYKSERAFIL